MSIPNELSSDIAVALLACAGDDPERLAELKEVILTIHATLKERTGGRTTPKRALAMLANSKQSVEVKREKSS